MEVEVFSHNILEFLLSKGSELAINIGIVLGFSSLLVYAPFDDDVQWRIMVATGAVMPIVMLYLSQYVLLESPRWLVAQEDIDGAIHVLSELNPDFSGMLV